LPSPPRHPVPQTEIIYYGPINDLPLISPALPTPKPRVRKATTKAPSPPASPEAAETYHPRQIIINEPLRPNHPRQTLIEPAAPPEPPKILPPLPNIVTWEAPVKPQLHIDPAALARLRPKETTARQQQAAVPDVGNEEGIIGPIDIADLSASRKPALPITPMSAPKGSPQGAGRSAPQPAPDANIAASSGVSDIQWIALSANPGPVMPPEIPQGNLQSRIALSPDAKAPGEVSASGNGGKVEGPGNGPQGLIIGAPRAPASSIAGLGRAARVMPATPAVPAAAPAISTGTAKPALLIDTLKPGAAPEALLGGKPIYTLHINMPNLTSAMGSWIVTFAEMGSAAASAAVPASNSDLSGPEPLRKVDPKYPPELRSHRVEGEVVLYAVIRKDGSVDSVQLVAGVDPTLDENSMQAFSQWKFRPGSRGGAPIDLEAIVHIPFRAVAPLY